MKKLIWNIVAFVLGLCLMPFWLLLRLVIMSHKLGAVIMEGVVEGWMSAWHEPENGPPPNTGPTN